MSLQERLDSAFEIGHEDEGASLSPEQFALYRSWRFIMEYEMNGLDGYFYNTLPDVNSVSTTIESLEKVGLTDLANILTRALTLFEGFKEPEQPSTWEVVRKQYDPDSQIAVLAKEMAALNNYGIQ